MAVLPGEHERFQALPAILHGVDGLPLIALVLASLAIAALCRRRGLAPPLVLVLAGIAASFVPGRPDFEIHPDGTILGGESLLNDAAALTLFRVAVAGTGTVAGGISLGPAVGMFLLAGVGGVVIGLATAWLVHQVRMRLNDSLIESAFGLVVPFAVYVVAEGAHTSGLLAVVVAGLYLGHRAPETGFATRLQTDAVWRASDTVLESVVFTLIGLQLTGVIREVGAVGPLLLAGLVVTTAAVVARVVWVFPATYLPGC